MQVGRASASGTRWDLVPFAGAATLTLLAPGNRATDGLTLGLFALCAAVRWDRLAVRWRLVPALGHLVLVAILRQAGDAADPAPALLALLPMLWLALTPGARRELQVAGVLAVGVVAVPPGPVVVSLGVALAAAAVERLVARAELAAAEAAEHSDALEERETTLRSVAALARDMFTTPDPRAAVCGVACSVARADLAYLLEPDGTGLLAKASSNPDLPALRIAVGTDPTGAVDGAVRHPAVSQRLLAATGAATLVFSPVLRDGRAVAVLAVGWRHPTCPHPTIDDALELLAVQATLALDRADLLDDLTVEARRDALTGLANRRAWDELVADEFARTRRSGAPLAVALLDLDRFKDYNDLHGHQAGDRLLKEAAAAWRGELRATDVLARWGGEEFALLLPACGAAEAAALLERVRARTPSGQTCSAGVAQWDGSEDPDGFVRRADLALYEAKRGGRDRVVAAREVVLG